MLMVMATCVVPPTTRTTGNGNAGTEAARPDGPRDPLGADQPGGVHSDRTGCCLPVVPVVATQVPVKEAVLKVLMPLIGL
jgi:hypothetical protein